MTSHLTEDQITRWFIGQSTTDERQHVHQCSTCTSEVARFQGTMSLFQSALQDRVERVFAAPPSLTVLVQTHTSAGQAVFGNFVEPPSLLTSLKRAIADALYPAKVETSVAPIDVPEIWSQNKARFPQWLSVALHALVITALIIPAAAPDLILPTITNITMLAPSKPLLLPPTANSSGGGGGGGMQTPTPPSKGELPRGADRQMLPPLVEPKNFAPTLIVEPTIIAPALSEIPPFSFFTIGDPNGIIGPPSAGPGKGGGIGVGDGTGVGKGQGPGAGDGNGGGAGGGPFRIGIEGGVTPPTLISKVDPQYSDDARKARIQGAIEILAVVNIDGTATVERVTKALGFGLEQKAIEALKQWRFNPGTKDGKPVPVPMLITVNFSIR